MMNINATKNVTGQMTTSDINSIRPGMEGLSEEEVKELAWLEKEVTMLETLCSVFTTIKLQLKEGRASIVQE
eukprot:31782-Eustigmatos_ZCMA.PRE.1